MLCSTRSFAKNPVGECPFFIDYDDIHSKIIKKQLPVSLMQEILNYLAACQIYAKLDISVAYKLIRVQKGNQSKLTFRTILGFVDHFAMQFGKSDTSTTLKVYIKNHISEGINNFTAVSLDDVKLYNKSSEELVENVMWIMLYYLESR
jgi:hypothetical protein